MKYRLHSFIYAAYMFGAAIKCSDVLLSVQDIFACIILVLWLFCSNIFCNAVGMKSELVDVLDFGAVGNGKADSSEVHLIHSNSIFCVLFYPFPSSESPTTYSILQAFLKAWNFVCSRETESVRLIVPGKHTFLLHPVTFSGQCKAREIKFLV